MSTSNLIPFCLKLDSEVWERISWYCDFVDDRYTKRYDLLREIKQVQQESTPLTFYFEDGRESSWL